MAMKMKQTVYGGPTQQILAIPDHYVAIAHKHAKADSGTPGLAVLQEGRYVVKAGTIYPANDGTAIGVILNDYDVTDGDTSIAVVVHGFIQTSKLPTIPSVNAISALKGIQFLPIGSAILPTLTATKANFAVGDASGTEKDAVLAIEGATFREGAITKANWTVAGESASKVSVDTITLAVDKKSVTIKLKTTDAAVAGDVTVLPAASIVSTNKTVSTAVTVATVA